MITLGREPADKVGSDGSDPISGRDAMWGQHRLQPTSPLDFFVAFFILQQSYSPYIREPIFAHNSSKDAV